MIEDFGPLLSALRRQRFFAFLMQSFATLHPGHRPLEPARYLEALSHALCEVNAGRTRRLVVTMPPRHLKSITAAVAFPAWVLGHVPTAKIMVASYSQDLARQLSNQTRALMESAWYQSDFPNTRISERGNRALELETTAGGARKAVSVGGSITGFGADIIIIDDCMKAVDARSAIVRQELRDWFDNTLLSRLNDKASGRIISIQQRLHEDDLPGYLLSKGYDHLNLPAIAERADVVPIGPGKVYCRERDDLLNPAREDRTTLEQMRRELGHAVFSAQYQQEPVTPEGNMLRLEWFGSYEQRPERHEFHKVIQSWDTGMTSEPTSDYSVCTTWGFKLDDQKWYLLDVFRRRMDFPDLKRAAIELWRTWRPDVVLVEKAGSGYSLVQDLRVSGPFRPTLITPKIGKEDRFNGCLAEVEAGHFLLPREAAWLDDWCAELRAFPQGKHDDQVDSFSQFVKYQQLHWRWVLTEFTDKGRPVRAVRCRSRPW